MVTDEQLGWAYRNRRTHDRVVPLVNFANTLLSRIEDPAKSWSVQIESIANEVLGSDFADQCSIGTLRSGILTVLVRDRRLLYTARIGWALSLLECLRTHCPSAGVRKLRFATGEEKQDRVTRAFVPDGRTHISRQNHGQSRQNHGNGQAGA